MNSKKRTVWWYLPFLCELIYYGDLVQKPAWTFPLVVMPHTQRHQLTQRLICRHDKIPLAASIERLQYYESSCTHETFYKFKTCRYMIVYMQDYGIVSIQRIASNNVQKLPKRPSGHWLWCAPVAMQHISPDFHCQTLMPRRIWENKLWE